ncbi:unnamed protein product [Allacma fusca]|uniref:Uncharacterized protein n=1 Tax=Allacma fusca TaxID=39272 RepID=A0A8J2KAQ1_9HEXA|nr:unnamed protein product [Allacma fusca]
MLERSEDEFSENMRRSTKMKQVFKTCCNDRKTEILMESHGSGEEVAVLHEAKAQMGNVLERLDQHPGLPMVENGLRKDGKRVFLDADRSKREKFPAKGSVLARTDNLINYLCISY